MLSKSLSKVRTLTGLFKSNFSSAKCDSDLQIPIAQKPGTGKNRAVTLVSGAGIGPEITSAVQNIFKAANCPITWDVVNLCHTKDLDNPELNKAFHKNETILFGLLQKGDRMKDKEKDPIRIYRELGLFANITYGRSFPNVNNRHKDVDIVVCRENTEGEYSGVEHEVYPGVVESLKITTKAASDKIANYAFEFAYISGRKKVSAVHKANIMKMGDGLFLESCREVAKKYPFLEYEEIIIDNCCMQLVKSPWKFDVMVMPNLYGTIVSNTIAGLVGGPGMTCGANIGDHYNLFEPGTRHRGSDIAGKNLANPTGMILSSIMMLKHLDLPKFATDIERALEKTYRDGKIRTKDVGGTGSTSHFVDEIISNLLKKA